MSTKSQQKRALREQREQQRRQAAEHQRRRRLWLVAASSLAALAVVGIAIALSQSSSSDNSQQGLGAGGQVAGQRAAATLFTGIPQRGTLLGRPDAPVRMVEFADLQCPFCAHYTRDVLPTLVRDYVRPGKLSIDLRLLTFLGTDSEYAGGAAVAAAKQNRIWQFTDVFYANQGQENSGYVTPDFIRTIATASRVNPDTAVNASQNDIDSPILNRATRQAETAGIDSTPTFLIGTRNNTPERFEPTTLQPDRQTPRQLSCSAVRGPPWRRTRNLPTMSQHLKRAGAMCARRLVRPGYSDKASSAATLALGR